MKITASFVGSLTPTAPQNYPTRPMIAVLGRSNVGKSSVLNSIFGHKLAHVSNTPGRTRTANLFLVNNRFYLVDLPGYGYARASKQEQTELRELITWFIEHFELKEMVLIIDAVVGPTALDREIFDYLSSQQITPLILANKIDKLNQKETQQALKTVQMTFPEHRFLPYSATKGQGRGALINLLLR